ncbi:MAG TPA: DUF1648 domain-containing protein [Dongiaceae bacterium]|nr:DUF1648 domain-containing protein [Dongiaceae bacterium]
MSDPRLPKLVYFLMLVLGLLQWVRVYAQLPPVMAAHFAANGVPNGFQPKELFFILMFVIVGLSAFVAFVVPSILSSKPPERLNLPNKSYWLAPEHRQDTFRFFRAQMAWFGCAILFVLLYGTSLAIKANLTAEHHFDSTAMLYLMTAFVLFCIVWVVAFVRHFNNIPPRGAGNPQT